MAKDKPPKKPSKTLDDILTEKYPDNEELRQRIKEDVVARGTEKQIVRGELKLPHPQDAEAHFRRMDAMKREEDE